MSEPARGAVELAARDGYGRLVAWLASRCRDLQLAEDAAGDALEAALRRWPTEGVPNNPEAWLLTVARRRMIDGIRRSQTRRDAIERLTLEAQEAADTGFRVGLPDRRLMLMFVCAHPLIPVAIRTPLMLQTVLGLNAIRIGSAMLVRPATLGQRLSRAKRQIKERAIPFAVPGPDELPERLTYVLEAIYAAYGTGWEATDETTTGLATEAIWLARLVVGLAPEVAEAKGLLSLMLHCEARREARRTPDGAFVPLEEQDTTRWDEAMITEAEAALWMASKLKQAGPYQMEAAIQSLHADGLRSGRMDWPVVLQLYKSLVAHYPSTGAAIGLAATYGRVDDAEAGLGVLDRVAESARERHQPFWAVNAHLLAKLGRADEARDAYDMAIGLSEDPSVRAWLLERRSRLA